MLSLSVIIPNFNKSKYIQQCVQSVINQTYRVAEIIIVDDCSTDNSVEIVRNLMKNDKRIILCDLTVNGGVSHARNVGAQIATSEYITFLDSDDYYFDLHKIENEVALLKKCGENSIAYSKIKYVDYQGRSLNIGEQTNYLSGNLYYKWLIGRNKIGLARDYCVSKKKFFEAGAYEEGNSFYEDLDLLIRLAKSNNFYCTNDFGTAYRQLTSGLSSKPREEHISCQDGIRNKYIQELPFFDRQYVRAVRSVIKICRIVR